VAAATDAHAFVTLKDGSGNDIKWTTGTISWYLNSNGSQDVPFDTLQPAIAAAFGSWDSVGCFTKSFSYGGKKSSDPENGIYIKFVESGWDPTVGDAAAYAQTWKNWGGSITNGVIVFNGVDLTWTTTEAQDYFSEKSDVQGVATHEIGHCLGLDHSRYVDATMFFSGGSAELASLTQDDKDGLCYIYGSFSSGKPCDSCKKDSQCANGYCLEYPDGYTYCGKNCTSDASCPDTFYCYDISGGNDQCAAFNGYCDQQGSNIPLGIFCYGHETCESGLCLALPDTAYCSKECTSNTQCGTLKCVAGYCVKGGNTPLGGSCQTHMECASALCMAVSASAGECTQACKATSECPSGFGCISGYCIKGGAKPYGAACSGGMECVTLNCISMGGDMGSVCSYECESSSDCPDSDPCTFGFCVLPGPGAFGAACKKHTDCTTGLCKGSPKYCTEFCGSGLPACPPGTQCKSEGYCSKPEGVATVCSSDADCSSLDFCKKTSQTAASGMCVRQCNPLSDSGCNAGDACAWYFIPWEDQVIGECKPDVGAGTGSSCGGATVCKPNLVCINVGGTGPRCYKDCDVKKNLGCDSDEACLSLAIPEDPRHGVCVCNAVSCQGTVEPDVGEQPEDTWVPTEDVVSPPLPDGVTEETFVPGDKDTGSGNPPPPDTPSTGGGGSGGCSSGASPRGIPATVALMLLAVLAVVRRRGRIT
jgi:uncharacterized protein (TIGR03382 family)